MSLSRLNSIHDFGTIELSILFRVTYQFSLLRPTCFKPTAGISHTAKSWGLSIESENQASTCQIAQLYVLK